MINGYFISTIRFKSKLLVAYSCPFKSLKTGLRCIDIMYQFVHNIFVIGILILM